MGLGSSRLLPKRGIRIGFSATAIRRPPHVVRRNDAVGRSRSQAMGRTWYSWQWAFGYSRVTVLRVPSTVPDARATGSPIGHPRRPGTTKNSPNARLWLATAGDENSYQHPLLSRRATKVIQLFSQVRIADFVCVADFSCALNANVVCSECHFH